MRFLVSTLLVLVAGSSAQGAITLFDAVPSVPSQLDGNSGVMSAEFGGGDYSVLLLPMTLSDRSGINRITAIADSTDWTGASFALSVWDTLPHAAQTGIIGNIANQALTLVEIAPFTSAGWPGFGGEFGGYEALTFTLGPLFLDPGPLVLSLRRTDGLDAIFAANSPIDLGSGYYTDLAFQATGDYLPVTADISQEWTTGTPAIRVQGVRPVPAPTSFVTMAGLLISAAFWRACMRLKQKKQQA